MAVSSDSLRNAIHRKTAREREREREREGGADLWARDGFSSVQIVCTNKAASNLWAHAHS